MVAPTVLILVALGLQQALQEVTGPKFFIFLYPAVFMGAFLGRFWPGVIATALATLGAWYFFVPFAFSFRLERAEDVFNLAVFLSTGVLSNWLGHRARTSRTNELATEAQFRQLQYTMNLLFDSEIVGIITWRISGGITGANDAFLRMFGYTREDLERGLIDWRRLTPPEWVPADQENLVLLRERGRHEPYEKEYYRKDGTRVPILVGSTHFEGSREEGVSFILNISEQRKAREELRHAVQARDEFLSIASHELKTPLTSIQLQTQIVARGLSRNDPSVLSRERVQRLVDQTGRQVDRIRRLVDDMLDVARIQSGHLSLQPARANLRSIVEDVVDRFAAGTDAAIELDCPEEIEGEWDAFRIEQVVTNLLTNAMRYGERKPIRISLRKSGDFGILSVSDQGLGIPPEEQERIFDRFERSSSTASVPGLGLGLFISREIVRKHQGRISVESAGPGMGSTFHVELPLS